MRRYWLLFAQTVTIVLGIYVVIAALRPAWTGRAPTQVGGVVPVLQAPGGGPAPASYRDAAGRAMPAVVNILTSKALRETHPLLSQEVLNQYHTDSTRISFVLFDEIEKASDALWQLLLGILDKATLTLGDNRRVDFSRSIVNPAQL